MVSIPPGRLAWLRRALDALLAMSQLTEDHLHTKNERDIWPSQLHCRRHQDMMVVWNELNACCASLKELYDESRRHGPNETYRQGF
jgi:hypothetical protein